MHRKNRVKIAEAQTIYHSLAKNRHYYGFLASIRLKKIPSFEKEPATNRFNVLRPYQSILNQIATLYATKQTRKASSLVNDFISELPKDEASALVLWVDSQLRWHDKAIYLSNNERFSNTASAKISAGI